MQQPAKQAWAEHGVISVGVANTVWVLPPTRALWIPAGLAHTTSAVAASALHSLYLRPERCPVQWSCPTVLAVLPLLAALIPHLGSRTAG